MEESLNIASDGENDEVISATWSSLRAWDIDHLLLSSKVLKVVEENEENLNTGGKNNNDGEESFSFEARVDASLFSRQGSFVGLEKEENIKKFESHVEEAFLSRQESISTKEKEQYFDNLIILSDNSVRKKTRSKKGNTLTVDSCFWAHVEEARNACKELNVAEENDKTMKNLAKFEEYGLLENYLVSPDIFLPQCSYMCWWNEYKAIRGTSYNSKLARFMIDDGNHKQEKNFYHFEFLCSKKAPHFSVNITAISLLYESYEKLD
ncbi:unnamed protein product [Sphenostylis stenocarpa]|uniref:EDS1 EP domain-containing protein n=1 Tax=Sphenostylis stenocarpa TaxID=92480 RepID=A0AA86SIQ4_9FABA|nr:unnamed protein product [Sphenostylis stenocarpa]